MPGNNIGCQLFLESTNTMLRDLKYELSAIDKLITENLQSVRTCEDGTLKLMHQELIRIKQVFSEDIFLIQDENLLLRYVQYHQRELIRMMDLLIEYTRDQPGARHFLESLDELLTFLQKRFFKYFDTNATLPLIKRKVFTMESTKTSAWIEKQLIKREVNRGLVNSIVMAFSSPEKEEGRHQLTYQRVNFIKVAQQEFSAILGQKTENLNEALFQAIIYLNVNSPAVMNNLIQYVQMMISGCESVQCKLEKLLRIRRWINQMPCLSGFALYPEAVSLQIELSNYVNEEIIHQQMLHSMHIAQDDCKDNLMHNFKLKFQASVSQLAYLLKIMMETKVIMNENITGLTHFLVRYVITKRTENLSKGSFRAKFYNVELSTKESVKSMLVQMIKHIDKTP